MFVKYNDLLRGFGAALAGCKGNRYVTTTHAINSCIVKASKLTKAAKVYRGMAGGVMPESFWEPNAQGVRGGIESAFMSTTFDRSVALHYATVPGKPAIVFEMQMGMTDRGAELGWLSQYPHEAECLFAPLTGVEVIRTRVEGATLIIEARNSVNLASLTIEQVVSKRRKILIDIAGTMRNEVCDALAPRKRFSDPVVRQLRGEMVQEMVHNIAASEPAEWFNEDANFAKAMGIAIKIKEALMESPNGIDLRGASMLTALPSRLGQCTTITELSLPWCMALTALPDTIGGCKALESLDLDCTGVVALPAGLAECVELQNLNLHNCSALHELPDLSGLQYLTVSDLPDELEPWQEGGYKAWQVGGPA